MAQIRAMRREERFCGGSPGVTKHAQEVPLGVELGGIAEVDHQVARYAVNAHACPQRALSIARVADLPQQRNHAQLLQQNCIEGDLVEAIEDLPGGLWRARALDGVDLHENCIVRLTFPHQGRDRGVAGIAAVPIILALDFDGLEHGRQTGGGEQHVGRDLTVAEHPALAGTNICGGDKQLDRRLPEPLEVDAFRKDLPQRVEPAGFRS